MSKKLQRYWYQQGVKAGSREGWMNLEDSGLKFVAIREKQGMFLTVADLEILVELDAESTENYKSFITESLVNFAKLAVEKNAGVYLSG